MDMIKKIYTILVLIKNLILRKKHYKLHFIAENDPPIKRWYYDFKYWGFDKANLEMVAGADSLCELYAKGNNEVTVDIIATKHLLDQKDMKNYDLFVGEKFIIDGQTHQGTIIKSQLDKYLYGRDYTNIKYVFDKNINRDKTIITRMWICPVTLFVLGRYPNFIYIKNK
jgi:hypothetical protein